MSNLQSTEEDRDPSWVQILRQTLENEPTARGEALKLANQLAKSKYCRSGFKGSRSRKQRPYQVQELHRMISKSKKSFPEFPSAAGVAIVVATVLENVTKPHKAMDKEVKHVREFAVPFEELGNDIWELALKKEEAYRSELIRNEDQSEGEQSQGDQQSIKTNVHCDQVSVDLSALSAAQTISVKLPPGTFTVGVENSALGTCYTLTRMSPEKDDRSTSASTDAQSTTGPASSNSTAGTK
jgi:hypothetical protein